MLGDISTVSALARTLAVRCAVDREDGIASLGVFECREQALSAGGGSAFVVHRVEASFFFGSLSFALGEIKTLRPIFMAGNLPDLIHLVTVAPQTR